MFELSVIL